MCCYVERRVDTGRKAKDLDVARFFNTLVQLGSSWCGNPQTTTSELLNAEKIFQATHPASRCHFAVHCTKYVAYTMCFGGGERYSIVGCLHEVLSRAFQGSNALHKCVRSTLKSVALLYNINFAQVANNEVGSRSRLKQNDHNCLGMETITNRLELKCTEWRTGLLLTSRASLHFD